MAQLVKINYLIFLLLPFIFSSHSTFANSCLGKGTVFFYGNGMFNERQDAETSEFILFEEIKSGIIIDRDKEIRTDLAYKTNESDLIQFFNVVSQKKIDQWENFWLPRLVLFPPYLVHRFLESVCWSIQIE